MSIILVMIQGGDKMNPYKQDIKKSNDRLGYANDTGYLNDVIEKLDSRMRSIALNGVTINYLVDSSFSSSSKNPVQNKVVTAEFAKYAKTENLAKVAFTGSYINLTDTPTNLVTKADLAAVAFTGNYTSLTNTPTNLVTKDTVATSGADKIIKTKSDGKLDSSVLPDNIGSSGGIEISDELKSKLEALPTNETLESTYAKKSDISSVYKPKGTVAFASLPTPSAAAIGDVYNIRDAFTTNANFVEGRGYDYPAGTNVVCVEDGTRLWDVLSGNIDLSGYLTKEDAEIVLEEISYALDEKQDKLIAHAGITLVNNNISINKSELEPPEMIKTVLPYNDTYDGSMFRSIEYDSSKDRYVYHTYDARLSTPVNTKQVLATLDDVGIEIDTTMSSSSTNPVQNKVVKEYIDVKTSSLASKTYVDEQIASAITNVLTADYTIGG